MDDKLNELMDMVRNTANSVVDGVSSIAGDSLHTVGQKAEDLMGITKINMEIFDLNTEVSSLMRSVGETVYATHAGQEVDNAVLMQDLGLIDAKKGKIEYLKQQANQLRGAKICKSCNARCDTEDKFCKTCGGKL